MIRKILVLIIFMALFIVPTVSHSQIIRATGNATEASTQLIFYYDQASENSVIQVTNTNDTESVTIHVQLFRSFDPDDDATTDNAVFCDERDFVDLLTPNDTHVYDLSTDNFTTNAGETEVDPGAETSITDTSGTKGFVVITPVVSEADFSAISFEHLIGITVDDGLASLLNAMGRSAVDLSTGEVLADGTVLDGVTGGFELLQPEELIFDIEGGSSVDVVGIAIRDSYGPPGLLGYGVQQGDATWTSFIFDYRENPTSCGNREVACFLTLGLNDSFGQNNTEFTQGIAEDLLCSGVETPDHPFASTAELAWTRMFVSGLTDTESHLGVITNNADEGAAWMFTNRDNVDNNVIQAPTGITTRATSQLVYYYDLFGEETKIQITNTNDSEGVWIHVQIFRNLDNAMEGIFCDERDFVDFLTPNDTHFYELNISNFPRNIGETAVAAGSATTIDLNVPDNTSGFVVITPIVSESDFSAMSFQHLVGTSNDDSEEFRLTAMGRDAVDLATGQILADGIVLDGTTAGFLLLQPEELLLSFQDGGDADVVGIAFDDNYGPPGLLGYNITPADVTWTPFIFDYNEDPTSCGNTPVSCFQTVGINDTKAQNNEVINSTMNDILLCAGTETPNDPGSFGNPVGWLRIFVSGLGENTNHMGFYVDDDNQGAEHFFVRGDRVSGGAPPENCAVAGDEDGDGNADCADPDCVGLAGPNGETCEATEASCADGQDNDGDGAVDGADTDCDGSEDCPTCESGDQCSDGEDNDGDGNSDCADGGCDGATGPNGETCEAGVELTCNDNQDNDGDGTVDCDDPDCAIATNCIAGEGGGGGGCSVASAASPSMLNFLLPLIAVGLVIGIRRKR